MTVFGAHKFKTQKVGKGDVDAKVLDKGVVPLLIRLRASCGRYGGYGRYGSLGTGQMLGWCHEGDGWAKEKKGVLSFDFKPQRGCVNAGLLKTSMWVTLRTYRTSKSPTAPMPPPTHIVTATRLAPLLRPSIKACPVMR